MSKLSAVVARERRLWRQKREIQELQAELEKLRVQNERLRDAMRRCLSCEYRIGSDRRG